MSVGFFLKYKDREITPIQIVVAFKGQYYKKSVGESISPKKWNAGAQRCTITGFPSGQSINNKLRKLDKAATAACDFYVEKLKIPYAQEFWEMVDKILNGGKIRPVYTFTDYYARYIERLKDDVRPEQTIKHYITTYNKLRDFEKKKKRRLQFEDIDLGFYDQFRKYVFDQGYSLNYFGTQIKHIKAVYREARDVDQIHEYTSIETSKFKVEKESADTIYLSVDELLRIHALEINEDTILKALPEADPRPQNLARMVESFETARNKFLIGAFTALRVSDFNRLDEVNIKGDYIRIKTKKTGVFVTVPIHWVIRDILKGGFDITTKISDQKLNKQIKKVVRMAGITEFVEVHKSIGGESVPMRFEKCDLITSHTARRSGATNMVLYGIDPISVMKITGHTKWTTFMEYVKINDLQNAQLVRKSGFFDKAKPRGNKKGNKKT